MKEKVAGKIIIMGPGRCGTTFLVRLLEALGEDTGGHHEIFRERRIEIEAGTEFVWPRVLKGTGTLCAGLDRWVREQNWEVDFVFLCVRDLEPNIQSMMSWKRGHGIYRRLTEKEFERRIRKEVLGGYDNARKHIKDGGYRCCEVSFPESARDVDYAYSCVVKAFPHINEEEFKAAWLDLVKPDEIHFK